MTEPMGRGPVASIDDAMEFLLDELESRLGDRAALGRQPIVLNGTARPARRSGRGGQRRSSITFCSKTAWLWSSSWAP